MKNGGLFPFCLYSFLNLFFPSQAFWKVGFPFLLIIYTFFSPYSFFQSLGIIILDFITDERWQPTQISLDLDCLILNERDILQQTLEISFHIHL
jgi:hypothetical protein